MTDAVLDASVLVKWFHSEGEGHVEQARALREQFEAGELRVLAPSLLWLEIVNVAARRWGWSEAELEHLATSLTELGFELVEPDLAAVAHWAARGLTAYDAAYVAVAQFADAQLVTDDDEILRIAPQATIALCDMGLPLETDPDEPSQRPA